MLPVFLAPLLERGLSLIANAVMAKGTEFVKEKTGIDLSKGSITPEEEVKLKQFEMEHEEELLKLRIEEKKLNLDEIKALGDIDNNENNNVSDRWKSDMTSDSWLSKNIRPMTLVYILSAYIVFAVCSAFGINVNQSYVNLLGQWGMLVMTAYFGGRTFEKIVELKSINSQGK